MPEPLLENGQTNTVPVFLFLALRIGNKQVTVFGQRLGGKKTFPKWKVFFKSGGSLPILS